MRPARLRRPRHPRGPQARGQPRAPGLARPQLRQGPGDAEPGHRSRPHPLPAEAGRRARRGPLGRVSWDEALDELGGRIRKAITEEPPERDHVPRRPPRRGRLHRARARGVGRRRPQLAHQHLLVGRARRLPVLDGHRPAQPRLRQRRRHLPGQPATSRRATTSTRTPSGSWRPGARGQADRARHPAVEHRDPRRPLARAPARAARPRSSWPSPTTWSRPGATTASSSAAGGTGRSTCAEPPGPPDATFEDFEAELRSCTSSFTFEHAAGSRARRRRAARDRRDRRRRRDPAGDPQLAQRRRRQPRRLAGVAHAVPAQRAARRGRVPGGTYPNGWNKFVPRADLHAAAPARCGTS